MRIIYTSRLSVDDLDDGAIGLCCHLFQEWIPKAFDVRLTAVGDRFFAVAVHAGSREATVDWRCRYEDLRYEVCQAPDAVCRGVLAYLHAFGLILERSISRSLSMAGGGFWSLPTGQWGWLTEETGLPIAGAIAEELVRAS